MVSFILEQWTMLLPTAVAGLTFLRMMQLLYQKKQSEKQLAPIVARKRIE